MMEKTMATTLEYESINDRISRLRKQGACQVKLKQRHTISSSQERFDRVFETNKQTNRLKIQDAPLKIDLNNLSLLTSTTSQRKVGISKRTYCRFTTQDSKKDQQNREETRPNSIRIPGKIVKNNGPKSRLHDINYVLSLNSKNS